MNRIILCKGGTDAILLSYYLEKVAGWTHCKRPPADVAVKATQFEQSVEWYENGSDERLLICGVGGKDNMGSFFQNKILRPIIDANAFSRIAVVLDRDENTIESLEEQASSIFRPIVTTMKNHLWTVNHYEDAFHIPQQIESLLVMIPTEHEGALETVMLDSIAENPNDAVLVEKAGEFVKSIRSTSTQYLKRNRDVLKAHLGVTWAVQYPEKVFQLMNEQIRSVAWEHSEVLRSCFNELIQI